MHDLITALGANGLWIMVIAVVAIGSWVQYRKRELQSHEELRIREMEHLQKMKELEIELEKAKSRGSSGQTA